MTSSSLSLSAFSFLPITFSVRFARSSPRSPVRTQLSSRRTALVASGSLTYYAREKVFQMYLSVWMFSYFPYLFEHVRTTNADFSSWIGLISGVERELGNIDQLHFIAAGEQSCHTRKSTPQAKGNQKQTRELAPQRVQWCSHQRGSLTPIQQPIYYFFKKSDN